MNNGGPRVDIRNVIFREDTNVKGNNFPRELKVIEFEKTCGICKGHGVSTYIPKRIEKQISECPSCRGTGWETVPCRNCKKGINPDGSICTTCKGKGEFIYHPTPRFQDGKVCHKCGGKGQLEVEVIVEAEGVPCENCGGTGNVNVFFNPFTEYLDVDLITEAMFRSRM